MAEHSTIEWTDATWNPITGCSVVSPGCTNCYAMRLAGTRLGQHQSRVGLTRDTKAGPVWNGTVRFNEAWLTQPLAWKRPRMIFVCAHGDLFAEGVPDTWIDQVFAVMALAQRHVFQVLTKRPRRMRQYLADPMTLLRIVGAMARITAKRTLSDMARGREIVMQMQAGSGWPLPHVWKGTSVEDQSRADERVPLLLSTLAAVRWISAEPLLGAVDFRHLQPRDPPVEIDALAGTHGVLRPHGGENARLDWVVVGGESGPGARAMNPDWARSIRDQCAATGTPFLFKQNGEWIDADTLPSETLEDYDVRGLTAGGLVRVGKKAAGRLLDGFQHDGMPEVRHG